MSGFISFFVIFVGVVSTRDAICNFQYYYDTRVQSGTQLSVTIASFEDCEKLCCNDLDCTDFTWNTQSFCITYSEVLGRTPDESSICAMEVFTPLPTMPSTPVSTEDPIMAIVERIDSSLLQINETVHRLIDRTYQLSEEIEGVSQQIERFSEEVSFCDRSFFPRLLFDPAIFYKNVIYSIGHDIYKYDLQNPVWRGPILVQGNPLPPNRARHTATLVCDIVYVCGGAIGSTIFQDCLTFDIPTKTWSPINNWFTARSRHAAVAIEEKIYFSGGEAPAGNSLDTFIEFNTATEFWRELPPMPRRALGHSAFVYENNVYIFGGYSGSHSNEIDMFDTSSETWSRVETTGNIPSTRSFSAIAVFGDHLFLHGGERSGGGLVDTYVYDLKASFWSQSSFPGDAVPASHRYVTYCSHSNRLFVFGGEQASDQFCQYVLPEID